MSASDPLDPTPMPDPKPNPAASPDLDDVAAGRAHVAREAAIAAALLAASPDCLKRLDLDGNVRWINDAGHRLFGVDGDGASTPPHACWTGWWDAVERGKVERAMAEARAGRTSQFDGWASTAGGEARCWSVTVRPILDESGRPVEVLAVSRDVTTLRAETALAVAHRRRPSTGSADGDAIAIVGFDANGRIESWNDEAATLFGRHASDVIGSDGDALWTPEDRAAGVPTSERATAATTGVARDERWHVRGDGGRVYVDGAMVARRDADGRVAAFVKLCRDETPRRSTEEQLAGMRRRLDSALIAGEVGTYEWDLSADRVVGDANFQRIFNVPFDDSMSVPVARFIDAVHVDDRPETVRRIEAAIAGDGRFETEYRIDNGGDGIRWVIARGRVERDAGGVPRTFGGVILDVTAAKRAEAERQAIAEERARQSRVYETILSTTDDFAYIFDLEGRVLYANRRLLEVWGVSLEDAVGRSLVELGYPVWHAAMHRKEIDEVIRTRRPTQGEVPFTGGSGAGGVYDYVFTPVIGPDGAVERVVGTTRDVTDRRRAEDATRMTANRSRFLADLADATRPLADPIAVLECVAQRLGEYLGVSRCAYADVADDGDAFVIHRDYRNVGVASSAGAYRLDLFGPRAAASMRGGRTLVIADVAAELAPLDAAGAATFESIACRAIVCCPLVRGGRLVAMMAVHQTTPRAWTAEDVSLVEAVVERAWGDVERARGVRALAESEARFRQLADAMPQIVWAARPDGTIDYYNRRWFEYTGLPDRGEVGDPSWEPVLVDGELPGIRAAWSASLASGEAYEQRYRVRRADGAYRWHLARALPARDAGGTIVRWYGTNTDVHDQKLAEAALAADKRALQRIAAGRPLAEVLDAIARGTEEQSVDGLLCSILLIDADGRRLRHGAAPGLPDAYNRAIDGIEIGAGVGCCGTAAHSREPAESVDFAADPRWAPYAELTRAAGLAACRSVPIVAPDGVVLGTIAAYYRRPHAAGAHDRELIDAAGRLAAVAIGRHRAEGDLAFQRHQLELIFQESPAAMALWSGEALVFERVNPEYEAWFGGRPLVGLSILDALPELRGQGFDEMLRRVLRTGEPFVGREVLASVQRSVDRPAEERFFDFSYLQVKDPQGRPWGVYDHAVDVTDRVRARQALEESQAQLRAALAEAERAGRMKDEFLATLSHELRTPLSAILGWSQMLARDGVGAETLRKGLATIERNARAQTQIIEDLLDMSRIISGKVALDTRRILLADVVRAAVETVGPTATAKQIELVLELGAEATPVLADANRLQQVFWNLLTNAIKFTPRGGSVRASLERRHSQWRVHVADSGEGIRADFLPFVFDRFRQADASTTRRHGGLGLGLAIVKQIAELHGGSVSVRSEGEGRGATFTVAIPMSVLHAPSAAAGTSLDESADDVAPIDDAPATPAAPADAFAWDARSADRLAGVRVLVVDDEPDARAMLRHLLESCRAIVEDAPDADAGVARCRAFRPDVLVSDVGMPGENGYAMLARIRALGRENGGDVPAVALTAYARADDRIRAIRAGFQLHVPKPVEPAELIASVASLVARR